MSKRTPIWTVYQPTGQFIEQNVELIVVVCTKLSAKAAYSVTQDRPDLRVRKDYADNA